MSQSDVEVAAEIIDIQHHTSIPNLTAPGVLIETCYGLDILDRERSKRELNYSPLIGLRNKEDNVLATCVLPA